METLIHRIVMALENGQTGPEIAEHFAKDGSPEDIWLAYQAARILDRDHPRSEDASVA